MLKTRQIAVLGAGSWGTALALYLARQHHNIKLWQKNAEEAKQIQVSRVNARYLPQCEFPQNIFCGSDLADICQDAELIIVATPSAAFREVLLQIKPLLKKEQILVWACKGLDPNTHQLLDHVANDILPQHERVAVLSGPNFASEIAQGLPAATTVASHHEVLLPELIASFKSNQLRVYGTTDVTGVEICGVLKNVMAIAVGICDGLELGANARAALITRGLAEISRLAIVLGAKPETMMGLAGIGDLILTCTDDKSRNRRFGKLLGQGVDVAAALKDVKQVVEGYANVKQAHLLAQQHHVNMPITDVVYQICYYHQAPRDAVEQLMSR